MRNEEVGYLLAMGAEPAGLQHRDHRKCPVSGLNIGMKAGKPQEIGFFGFLTLLRPRAILTRLEGRHGDVLRSPGRMD
jgi:hypothetical protein